jgi:serine protease Do
MKARIPARQLSLIAVALAAALAGALIGGGSHMTQAVAAENQPAVLSDVDVSRPFDFASLAERVVPSVVSVFSTDVVQPDEQRQEMPMDPFEFFFGPGFRHPMEMPNQPMVRQSAGSGFFIAKEGELLTNNHVVEGADKIQIQLNDRTRYDVEVVGRDPATDIAVLKIVKPDRDYPVLPLGDSEALRVGEWVMAVGNPLNMDHTVTVGVVSAKGRVLGLADNALENFIQTDAAINFGNSGGPLVDISGRAVGINTAINAGGQNLGFAVPISIAERILPQLRESGKVVRGYLGAQIRDVDAEIQKAFRLDSKDGAFVEEVVSGHAADKAGLRHGDTVIAVDGQPVKDARALIDAVSTRPPGTRVNLDVVRDGKPLGLKVKLEERPGTDEVGETGGGEIEDNVGARIGVAVEELTPRLRDVYHARDDVSGLVITRVSPMSPAGEEGLRPGDVITEANGAAVATAEELERQIKDVEQGGYLRLYVYRPQADRFFFAILNLAE